jgi:hypothetical protein
MDHDAPLGGVPGNGQDCGPVPPGHGPDVHQGPVRSHLRQERHLAASGPEDLAPDDACCFGGEGEGGWGGRGFAGRRHEESDSPPSRVRFTSWTIS